MEPGPVNWAAALRLALAPLLALALELAQQRPRSAPLQAELVALAPEVSMPG